MAENILKAILKAFHRIMPSQNDRQHMKRSEVEIKFCLLDKVKVCLLYIFQVPLVQIAHMLSVHPNGNMRVASLDISFVLLFLSSLCIKQIDGKYNIEGLPTLRYSRPGHVKLALMNSFLEPGDLLCKDVVYLPYLFQYQLMTLKTIEKVNADPNILGNITIGIEVLENCQKSIVAVGQAMKLAPNTTALGDVHLKKDRDDMGVVGLIGPLSSPAAMAIAPVLNLFNMPLISATASSDTLRDRVKYSNFFRVIPADSFQAKAVIDLIAQFDWNYISIVHSENSYGYNALKFLWKYARKKGVCVADTFPIPEDATDEDREILIKRMSRYSVNFPHAVVLMAYPSESRDLLEKVHEMNIGNFIFICGESATAFTYAGLNDTTQGAFILNWYAIVDDEIRMLQEQTAIGNEDNPYFQRLWSYFFSCNISTAKNTDPCMKKTVREIPNFLPVESTKNYREIVQVYSQAIENVVKENCPQTLKNPSQVALSSCVTPDRLLNYVKNMELKTADGIRKFDDLGEMKVDYMILQKHSDLESVGIWRYQSETIEWIKPLQWRDKNVPESICARPCELGEFYIQGELPCCWECHRCRDNEYVANNATTCITCPYLTWPDQSTFTTCVPIPASFMQWSDIYSIGLCLLSGVGLLSTLIIILLIIKYKERKVIKGASLPMISVILTGILLVFSGVMLLIAEPSFLTCIISRISFSLSCTLIFVPLLLKTHRVYLVFAASSKFTRVSVIGKASVQYFLVAFMVGLQIALLTVSAIYWPIEANLGMPVPTEKYVELYCEQNQIGLFAPLSYNLLLILLCTIIAFMTRKLPDNFNESWYIFLSVSTTLFVWVAFLPTYYAAFYAYHKAALLALALALNGAVPSLCLFGPKIYALFYIDEKDIKITDFSHENFEKTT